MAERRWRLETAREILPEVRRRTERAVREAERLLEKREGLDPESAEAQAVEKRVRDVVSRWQREMEALGTDVKGLWLVDFDTGAGYYCWKWPEEELAYFHGYEEGFAGRARIQ